MAEYLDTESSVSNTSGEGSEHHCPYCGEDEKSAEHVLNCGPFE